MFNNIVETRHFNDLNKLYEWLKVQPKRKLEITLPLLNYFEVTVFQETLTDGSIVENAFIDTK